MMEAEEMLPYFLFSKDFKIVKSAWESLISNSILNPHIWIYIFEQILYIYKQIVLTFDDDPTNKLIILMKLLKQLLKILLIEK